MSYTPPAHIILIRRTDAITDKDVEFLAEALRIQLAEAAADYGWRPPGVSVCTDAVEVSSDRALLLWLVDDDGSPMSVGWHGYLAGTPCAVVGVKEVGPAWTRVASHEALEYLGNYQLNRWVRWPGGGEAMYELCDCVEATAYTQDVELFGERRKVELCNYVLPAYWEPGSDGPWDRLRLLTGPLTIAPGGYTAVFDERNIVTIHGGAGHGSRKSQPHARPAKIRSARMAGLKGERA